MADWSKFLEALRRGEPLACTQEQWLGGLRGAVQDYAGKMIDMGQDVYAIIALEEVRANDARYGLELAALAAKKDTNVPRQE